ncbi:Rieske 2Fe-2S domain-containing protein [Cyanobium sp. NIES-981]|uniref:aromatic ring-hydroxylating dioxygenase subunit alpha n=1 Tax=Cyanobium sp. NIES-981 TaxID=1851505 RepID=UPI0007DDBA3B|nr:Rieske 2Fe-2S domain-containing protein [Cyanobium sp. NIES-981]SBO42141.1 Pheophorbide A oxygenase [Cyanobium sp. NIES-981]
MASSGTVPISTPGSTPSLEEGRRQNAWRQRWYPVAYLEDLDPGRPTAFTLLEQDLVLWWDAAAATWRAFEDVCPHRLVPLSEGRLNDRGELECPYHGWSFDGSGLCTAIPQADPAQAAVACGSARSRCTALPTATGQGLLFVFSGDPERAPQVPLPLVPQLEEPGWLVQDTFRDLPMDALTLLENVLDVSHVPFTHHRTVGRRENAAPVQASLTSEGPEGFTAEWLEGPRRGRLGSQFTTFAAPALMWHDLTAKGFARILTVVYATPIRPGECRLFARFPFQFRSALPRLLLRFRPRWLQHIANHTVLEDDQVFLHWQERALARRGGSHAFSQACFLPTDSDRYVRALHAWVNGPGGEPFPGRPLPERLDRDQLMDRDHAHTRHCHACSTAQRRLRAVRPWLQLAVAVALVGLAALWGQGLWVGRLALAALALAGWLLLRQCERWERGLSRGAGAPPRNAPEPRRGARPAGRGAPAGQRSGRVPDPVP